jgi:hypothetical protein
MLAKLFPTSLVGSYPQPDWLIDRARLSKMVPRVRMDDLWLVDPKALEAKQDEATLLAIQEQERAGLDIITDGVIGGARVTPIGLPQHLRVSIRKIPVRRSTAAASRSPCRV